MNTDHDAAFSGSIPDVYQRHLVPLLFEPYARDLARRVAAGAPSRVLEIAAGTGAVTRHLAAALPDTDIVATDLNLAMLQAAQRQGTALLVRFEVADAARLPFGDASFDTVVCQFGVMFFPDKVAAFAQARRVLRPGGRFWFSTWAPVDMNELADTVYAATNALFPVDPPTFFVRTPHGYHDRAAITGDLARAGFAGPEIDTVELTGTTPGPRDAALAFCQGTPLRFEIEARGMPLEEATDVVTAALERRFGSGAIAGRMCAYVISAVA